MHRIIAYLLLSNSVICGDPMQNMVRDVIVSIRTMGERFLSSLPVASNLMYQIDPKASQAIGSLADFVNVCPPSVSLPNLEGFWQITHLSQAAIMGVFTEVEQLINRISMGGPAYVPKSLADFLRIGELPHCMSIGILYNSFPVSFEYSFGSQIGRKSIIGQLSSVDGRSLSFGFGGDVELRTTLVYASPTDDILVMADIESVPKCSNIMVMRRNQSYEGRIFDQLVSQGSSPLTNPLVPIPCP